MQLSITISTPGSKFAPIVLQGEYAAEIEHAARLGFAAVELHIRDPKAIDRAAIREALRRTGLAVSTIGTGQAYVDERLCFSDPDPGIRAMAVQRIRDQIDFAAQLGTKVIIGTIKGNLPADPGQTAATRERIVACLSECASYAAQSGVTLTLEAINRYESNFLNSAADTVAFIQSIGSPALGLHLDTFHMNIEESDIAAAIKTSAPYLAHIHFADSNRWPPGMGHLDFGRIVASLKEAGYQGFMGVECLPRPAAESAARQSLEHIGKIMADLQ
ncbi:sugar phosphate isomerase/epimerase [Hydrogenispora ethanolica]|uniref:Sugar phosphate isomerase/epimerase n=1 Tax=Hydrogenispora ethanolica TaxID=1082276 RepID=A0A4R1QWC3_HYDET|nr:sugar phosphate isomerase/epimerase family protein [Hydrogenispora ethanolica]TCL57713.1 sugar phosphate isomerase/epimerase [Hydrogenispora ethanolica]